LAAKYDYEKIGLGRLTNDALIAMSAVRLGITVITANARDFPTCQVPSVSMESPRFQPQLTLFTRSVAVWRSDPYFFFPVEPGDHRLCTNVRSRIERVVKSSTAAISFTAEAGKNLPFPYKDPGGSEFK
jgi:hypothetical protein